MALKRVSIPITDELTAGSCTQAYRVRYRVIGSEIWAMLVPNPIQTPIIIQHLTGGATYQAEIIRVCCDGNESPALIYDFTVPA